MHQTGGTDYSRLRWNLSDAPAPLTRDQYQAASVILECTPSVWYLPVQGLACSRAHQPAVRSPQPTRPAEHPARGNGGEPVSQQPRLVSGREVEGDVKVEARRDKSVRLPPRVA
jgi:hypothetical protein